jgi:hypothetical protein
MRARLGKATRAALLMFFLASLAMGSIRFLSRLRNHLLALLSGDTIWLGFGS